MPSGAARIDDTSTIDALLRRHWSHRRPVPTGLLGLLTVAFWAVWIYLVLPILGLLLWAFGIQFIVHEMAEGGYQVLLASLASYSAILLVVIGLLALWILWNVFRYGGRQDRRTVKRPEVPDAEVGAAFRLDDTLLGSIRGERFVRLDLDTDDCVVFIDAEAPRPGAAAQRLAPEMA
jgi:poly-beta-1,6-N-acetyl-D-glucosamine biosynthesis protein PgaD